MSQILIYALKVNVAIMLFYLFHMLMFRKDTFWKVRRAYLLIAVIFSFVYPLMKFGEWFQQQTPVQTFAAAINLNEITITAQKANTTTLFTAATTENVLFAIYILITFALFFKIILQLFSILFKSQKGEKFSLNGIDVIHLNENITPFSFFKFIFINKNQHSESVLPEILAHELTHVTQRHSYDVILSELMTALCWFNPFAWLLKKEIKQNLEFLADNQVVKSGFEVKEYQYLLLNISCNYVDNQLINQFNISPLKKRILMMNKQQTSKKGLIKYILIIPVALVMIIINSAQNVVAKTSETSISDKAKVTQFAPVDDQSQILKTETVEKLNNAKLNTTNADSLRQKKTIKFVPPTIVFNTVETPPSFPGGESALYGYLANNIKYPVVAQENGAIGKVTVGFVVNSNGQIQNAKVAKSDITNYKPEVTVVGYAKKNTTNPSKEDMAKAQKALEDEALRVINAMPEWTPAKVKGENVACQFYIPVNFRLQ